MFREVLTPSTSGPATQQVTCTVRPNAPQRASPPLPWWLGQGAPPPSPPPPAPAGVDLVGVDPVGGGAALPLLLEGQGLFFSSLFPPWAIFLSAVTFGVP